jgi:general secretion pathway protein D
MWSPMPPVCADLSRRPRATGARRALAAALCILPLMLAGCATSGLVQRGRHAEQAQDYDQAVVEYTKALRLKPGDPAIRMALERAKLRAAEFHYNRGRLLAAGKLDDAVVEFQVALELNPTSGDYDQTLRETRNQLRAKVAVAREGKTALETLIERTRDLPPPGLDLPKGLKLPASLIFREASSRDVFTTLARLGDLSVVFDPTFRDSAITVDLRNATFEDALTSVAVSTRNFCRMTAPRTITVIPDTPSKRREYEEEIVRTFYLSNADIKETIDLLRMVVELRRIAPITGTNAISIKDTPERVQAAGRVIAAIDKARAEVVIDVELLEVNRTRLQEYGLQIATPGSEGISGTADVNRQDLTLFDLRNLTQAGVFLTGLPALYYRLLKSDESTRTLANPQLRASEGMSAEAKFGEKVPVPVTTFSPIATGGVAQQPITSFTYENIGVNINITPRTHHNDDVSLALKIELTAISGTGFSGLPTFGNRQVTTTIRLRDGETSVLAGLIRDDERRVLGGIPGLSDIPGIGRIFSRNRKETQETDIILTLTPHIIRILDLTEADLRPFRVSRDAGSTLIELPLLDLPPRDPPKTIKPPGAGEIIKER